MECLYHFYIISDGLLVSVFFAPLLFVPLPLALVLQKVRRFQERCSDMVQLGMLLHPVDETSALLVIQSNIHVLIFSPVQIPVAANA
jgi:hypothetical protein